MRIGEPDRPLVVKVGERPGLEDFIGRPAERSEMSWRDWRASLAQPPHPKGGPANFNHPLTHNV